jgi:predicted DNA-binding transcriptional regulator AlpA
MSSNQLAENCCQNAGGKGPLKVTFAQNLATQVSHRNSVNHCDHCNTPLHTAATDTHKLRFRSTKANVDHTNYLYGDGYLRLAQVLQIYPVSRAAWYAGIKDGIYPPPTQLGKRSVGWSRQSIRELVTNPPKF